MQPGSVLGQEAGSSEFLNLLDWGVGRPVEEKITGAVKSTLTEGGLELPFWMEPQPKSFIRWEKIDTESWLNFQDWKHESALKDLNPKWRTNRQDLALQETIGRVIHCIGLCRIYRGEGFANVQFRSRFQEGDEIVTMQNSYMWIVLLDGTMVRISPESSVTLKEINLSTKEVFYHVRLNAGQIIWLSRKLTAPPIKADRETDPLFYPLPLYTANKSTDKVPVQEGQLFNSLISPSPAFAQAIRLRDFMTKNTLYMKNKKSKTFLVMPNGTVRGEALSGEFVVLLGDKSMMKIFPDSLHYDEGAGPLVEVPAPTFFYRGHENTTTESLEKGKWYVIDPKGRSLADLPEEEQKTMGLGEFFVSQIPTLMLVREMMMQQYTKPLFSLPPTLDLYGGWQYRMWNRPLLKDDELKKREEFLIEYTRREETTGLLVAEKFRGKMQERGETFNAMSFGPNFYALAIDSYMANGEILEHNAEDREELNSTKNPFWKYVKRKP
ncbi:MAG: hypothetical protein A2X86_19515 [Bdellovibrionales bacterium GWA2_49_15]|nr:MAG: hypothetical protein A2X86_19515 [Bdellovibrionales bacterium GWA2_49_15]HAZ14421.1 hypothetical protein [Bdellovibrionales bacterium]